VLNPFIWDRPLDDPSKIVGMEAFAHQVALTLKGQTNVALFGPRDTGKTTFINQLALELAKNHGDDAPPFDVIKVNLQRVVSIPGFIGCVHDAMTGHPVKSLRRAAQRQIGALEKEVGFDIRIIKGSVKSSASNPAQNAETLHAQLLALRSLSSHLVVVFDEFQRLRHCPGDPLAIIRSALMSSGSNHVSLLFTGSIRNALKMMLEDSRQPIFGEAAQMQLPAISHIDFLEYLDYQFDATGRPADEDALNYLLSATGGHPRSTQQLAWECWTATAASERVTLGAAIDAHDRLVQSIERSEFASVLNVLMSGDDAEANEVRALQLLADRGGEHITSRPVAARYGFSSHSRVRPALVRLQGRGLVDQRGGSWYVVDPLFGEWLRRASPLADTPG
jgi:AAA domain